MNDALKSMGADFRLINLKSKEKKRGSEELFCLRFVKSCEKGTENEVAIIKLDGSNECEYHFKNSLSDSNKRLLSFALFVAQLQNSNDLDETVVLLDDPMSSFDIDRKTQTVKFIRDCLKDKNGNKAKQLIILTHEDAFFKILHDCMPSCESKYLRIEYKRSKNTSELTVCDVNEEFLKDDYFKDMDQLNKVLKMDDADITTDNLNPVRKLLEHIMKRKYYFILEDEIKSNASVSTYTKKLIDKKIYGTSMQNKIDDLFLHESHHDANEKAVIKSFEPREVRTIVKNFFNLLPQI